MQPAPSVGRWLVWRLRASRPRDRARAAVESKCGPRAGVGGLPYDRAVATNDVVRQNALARIDAVQAVVHALPAGSPIAAVLTDAYLQEQRKWVGDEADLENAEWPPLLGWTIAPWRADKIALLDSDIQMVRDHPTSNPVQATAWLSAKRGESRKLAGRARGDRGQSPRSRRRQRRMDGHIRRPVGQRP